MLTGRSGVSGVEKGQGGGGSGGSGEKLWNKNIQKKKSERIRRSFFAH